MHKQIYTFKGFTRQAGQERRWWQKQTFWRVLQRVHFPRSRSGWGRRRSSRRWGRGWARWRGRWWTPCTIPPQSLSSPASKVLSGLSSDAYLSFYPLHRTLIHGPPFLFLGRKSTGNYFYFCRGHGSHCCPRSFKICCSCACAWPWGHLRWGVRWRQLVRRGLNWYIACYLFLSKKSTFHFLSVC